MAIGARIILRPNGIALGPQPAPVAATETADPAITSARRLRIHQARKSPLGFFLIVGRKFNLAQAVFNARIFAKRWQLKPGQSPGKYYGCARKARRQTEFRD